MKKPKKKVYVGWYPKDIPFLWEGKGLKRHLFICTIYKRKSGNERKIKITVEYV